MAAGATYEPIASQTLASAASSITFSSIASSWTDLRLVVTYLGAGTTPTIYFRINGDTTTSYSNTRLWGNGTSAQSSRETTVNFIQLDDNLISSTYFSLATVDLFSYAGSTYKTILSELSTDRNGAADSIALRRVGLWRNTAAVTSVAVLANLYDAAGRFAIGTTATLYGIKAA